jgi:hypothetical protein
MKNRITFLGALSAAALVFFLMGGGGASGQLLIFPSIESQASFGLFHDALDAAASVSDMGPQPTFSKLTGNYFFGALTNPFSINATGGLSGGLPLVLGYYWDGARPSSLFGQLFASATQTNLNDGTVVNAAALKAGAAGTTYDWNTRTTATTYAFHQAYSASEDAQYLMKLGSLNLGFELFSSYQQNAGAAAIAAWAAANRTTTTTYLYDTAGAGVAPTPTTSYTDTTVYSAPDSQFKALVGVPIYFAVGGIGIMVAPQVGYTYHDASTSTLETFTAPQGPVGFAVTPVSISTTDVTGLITANLTSTLFLPSLVKGNPDDQLLVNLNGSFDLHTASDSVLSNVSLPITAPGSGGAIVPAAGGTSSVTTSTRGGGIDYSFMPSVQQLIYVSLGAGTTLAMGPSVNLGVTFAPTLATYTTKSVQVISTDGNADNNFTDATDSIATTTMTFYHANDGGTWNILTGLSFPADVIFQVPGGFLSILVGGDVGVSHTLGITSAATTTQDTTTLTTNGVGTVTVPQATTLAAASYSNTSVSSSWSFSGGYALGLNFSLPGDAKVDVLLRNFTFSIQGIIPMK